MGAKKKTTLAMYRTARFNPATSQEDRDAVAIIQRLEADGYNFKQIAQDAILRADGKSPDMYAKPANSFDGLRSLLEEFAQTLIDEIRSRGSAPAVSDDDDYVEAGSTQFVAKFAASFLDRQRKGES